MPPPSQGSSSTGHRGEPAERRAVQFAAEPGSRLFIAICIAAGGAILAACLFLGMGEVLFALKRYVLEAIVLPKVS
jgi:hypothetical protein